MRVLLALFLLFSLSFVHAQHTLSGSITNESLQPIPLANVYINELQKGASTNDDGYFIIDGIPTGEYTLTITYIGKKRINRTINIEGDRKLDFIMVNDNTLEEVLVSTVRVDASDPFTYSNITEEQLSDRNLGQDIPVLMNYMPSVISSSDAGAGIGYTYMTVRGSDASRINVTINGIPYNDAESQGTFWVDIPDMASSSSSIQLQRGVGTSTNGASAFGASLNVLTDVVSRDAGATLSSSIGSYNTRKNTVKFTTGLLNNHFEFSGRLSDIYSDGYVDRAYSDLFGYQLQGTYIDTDRLVKFLTFGGREKTYQAWYGLTPEQLAKDRRQNPYTYDEEVDDYDQDHYQFHWNEKFNNTWSAKIGLNYTKGKGFFEQEKLGEDPADYANIPAPNADGEADVIVRRWLDNDFYVGNFSIVYAGNINVETGLSYSDYTNDHFGEVIWASALAEGKKIRDRYYEANSRKNDFSTFTKWTLPVTDKFNVYADLQLRKVDYVTKGLTSDRAPLNVDQSYTFFNPKFGLNYNISNSHKLYLSYARANREPNRNDFENGVTEHESLDNIELGSRYTAKNFLFNANLYLMSYTNQLVLTGEINDVGAPLRATSGESYRAGIELDATYRIIPSLSTTGNLTLSSNKNVNMIKPFDGKLTKIGKSDIAFSPSVIASNVLSYAPANGWDISFYTKYVGEQYMSNFETKASKLDDYLINDLSIRYQVKPNKFVKSVSFKVLLNNLFSVEYVDRGYYYFYDDNWSDPNKVTTIEGVGYYPQATFNALAGIEIKF